MEENKSGSGPRRTRTATWLVHAHVLMYPCAYVSTYLRTFYLPILHLISFARALYPRLDTISFHVRADSQTLISPCPFHPRSNDPIFFCIRLINYNVI